MLRYKDCITYGLSLIHIYGVLIGKFFSPAIMGLYTQARKLEEIASTSISSVVNLSLIHIFRGKFIRGSSFCRQFYCRLVKECLLVRHCGIVFEQSSRVYGVGGEQKYNSPFHHKKYREDGRCDLF